MPADLQSAGIFLALSQSSSHILRFPVKKWRNFTLRRYAETMRKKYHKHREFYLLQIRASGATKKESEK